MTTPSSFSNHTADAVRLGAAKAADSLTETAEKAKDTASEAARLARNEYQKVKYELGKVATQTERLARENPYATAGVMFGIGALVGALAYKLFSPKPTLAGMLGVSHLPESARKQMKQLRKLF